MHDRDHQHLGPADLKHGCSAPAPRRRSAALAAISSWRPFPWRDAQRPRRRDARPSWRRRPVSSSAMPFLKLLMPLAMSPISSGILPRPNTQQHDDQHDQPVPDRKGTHCNSLPMIFSSYRSMRFRRRFQTQVRQTCARKARYLAHRETKRRSVCTRPHRCFGPETANSSSSTTPR